MQHGGRESPWGMEVKCNRRPNSSQDPSLQARRSAFYDFDPPSQGPPGCWWGAGVYPTLPLPARRE